MDRVDQEDEAASQAEVPEGVRHHALLAPLRSEPLDEEPAEEERLAGPAEDLPPQQRTLRQTHRLTSSARCGSIQRLRIQRTAIKSASARNSRLPIPYLAVPCRRGRWRTGISRTRAPFQRTRVGRNRCMPVNIGRWRRNSAR